jgi:hypothetical protein
MKNGEKSGKVPDCVFFGRVQETDNDNMLLRGSGYRGPRDVDP